MTWIPPIKIWKRTIIPTNSQMTKIYTMKLIRNSQDSQESDKRSRPVTQNRNLGLECIRIEMMRIWRPHNIKIITHYLIGKARGQVQKIILTRTQILIKSSDRSWTATQTCRRWASRARPTPTTTTLSVKFSKASLCTKLCWNAKTLHCSFKFQTRAWRTTSK